MFKDIIICNLIRQKKLNGIRNNSFETELKFSTELLNREKKIKLVEDEILKLEKNILKENMDFESENEKLNEKYKKNENDLTKEFQMEIDNYETKINKKKYILNEYEEFLKKKEVLISEHNELEEQLKFEKEYIEKEKLKFCEEKLIHKKLISEEIKENFEIESNIKNINKKLDNENKKYQNFYKQKNKFSKILLDLSKNQKIKENININKQLFVNHQKILDKMEDKADKKLKNYLIKIQNNQDILFNNRKKHELNKIEIQKNIKKIKENFFKTCDELKEKKNEVVLYKKNFEFLGKALTNQRKIFLKFYQNCIKHLEEELKYQNIKKKNKFIDGEQKQEIMDHIESLNFRLEFLKRINIKFSK